MNVAWWLCPPDANGLVHAQRIGNNLRATKRHNHTLPGYDMVAAVV